MSELKNKLRGRGKWKLIPINIFLVVLGFAFVNFRNTYSTENIPTVNGKWKTKNGKRRLLLTVGVLTELSLISRRAAIRATWFNTCRENKESVVCTFFTDTIDQDLSKDERRLYLWEKETYGDLLYMPFKG